MFDFELNQKKGWPSPYAVDYAAEYADGETGVKAGMVVSLDSNGKLVRGLSGDNAMAIFALQSMTDFDVLSDKGNVSGGVGSGLVAAGAYELQSTEFVSGLYPPNTPLTVDDGSVTPADKGKLKSGTVYTDPIVGVVSAGLTTSEHNADIQLLAFWPRWLPPTP
jgi:hypothetical protein